MEQNKNKRYSNEEIETIKVTMNQPGSKVAKLLKRTRQAIYCVRNSIKKGETKESKSRIDKREHSPTLNISNGHASRFTNQEIKFLRETMDEKLKKVSKALGRTLREESWRQEGEPISINATNSKSFDKAPVKATFSTNNEHLKVENIDVKRHSGNQPSILINITLTK